MAPLRLWPKLRPAAICALRGGGGRHAVALAIRRGRALAILGLSAANTLNVIGFRKDFFEPAMIAHLPAGLEVVAAIQTILFGTILLFLFGLGVRNRFRMK
jgi:hypothetical protein